MYGEEYFPNGNCIITKELDINLRYSYGLLNIVKVKNLYGSYDTEVSLKNRL